MKDTPGNYSNPLSNENADYQIIAYGGNDTITNSGARASIMAISGNNIIRNTGANVVIDGGSGIDSITNENANNVSISGGAGNDIIDIKSSSSGLTVVGGAGNDSINSEGNTNGIVYEISSGAGTDSILGFKATDTIKITDTSAVVALGPDSYNKNTGVLTLRIGNSYLLLQGDGIQEGKQVTVYKDNAQITDGTTILRVESVTLGSEYTVPDDSKAYYVVGTTGADTINNGTNTGVSILAGAEADQITNNGASASILAGIGNDTITNSGASASIYGEAGADNIINNSGGTGAKIYAGADNDTIGNEAANVYIAGEAGDDTITTTGDNVTIWGGTGNDILDATGTERTKGVVYQFNAAGEGTDSIVNFKASGDNADKLWFSGATAATALPKAVSISASHDDPAQTFTLTAYNNVNIIGTVASGEYMDGANSATPTIAAYYGSDFTEGSINIVRILSGDNYSTANSSSGTLNNTVNVALNLVGGQKVANTGVTNITAIGDSNNYIANTASNRAVEEGETQTYVYLTANGGDDTIINGVSSPTDNEGKYAIINAGNGLNEITNYAANVSITAGTGEDTITNSGDSVLISAGNGANTISNEGSNVSIYVGNGSDSINSGENTSGVYINAGAGADFITISGGANGGGNTVVLGGGNDVVSVNEASQEGKGNTYVLTGSVSEGTKSITNFSSNDIIRINANHSIFYGTVNRTASGTGNADVHITLQKTSAGAKNPIVTYIDLIGYNIPAEDGTSKTIKLQFNDQTVTWGIPGGYTPPVTETVSEDTPEEGEGVRIAEDPVAALDDLFADDNYMTNDAQISDITALTQDNYSAGNIETFDLENIAKSGYTPTATYGEDDKNK